MSSTLRHGIIACVAIEFFALAALFAGVTPAILWIGVAAATISTVLACLLAAQVFRPLAAILLGILNVVTCIRLWSLPFLISADGVSKYVLIITLLVRIFGWVSIAFINQRAAASLKQPDN